MTKIEQAKLDLQISAEAIMALGNRLRQISIDLKRDIENLPDCKELVSCPLTCDCPVCDHDASDLP